jgi:ribosome-associated toxin RatA of RatAB toxin-antitoxin module
VPYKITEHILIEVPATVLFDYTQDYSTRLHWDTFLRKAVILHGATAAAQGVSTYCEARNFIGMETVYLTFNRPKVTAVKMTKGPWLFKSFSGSWQFITLSDYWTDVIFTYSFTLRFPFSIFGRLIQLGFKRNVRQRLLDLSECMRVKNEMPGV